MYRRILKKVWLMLFLYVKVLVRIYLNCKFLKKEVYFNMIYLIWYDNLWRNLEKYFCYMIKLVLFLYIKIDRNLDWDKYIWNFLKNNYYKMYNF